MRRFTLGVVIGAAVGVTFGWLFFEEIDRWIEQYDLEG